MGHVVNRLAPAMGAEVLDLDLGAEDAARIVAELIVEHQVIAIRDQSLEPTAFTAFAERLGTPAVHPLVPHLDGFPAIQEIKNYGKQVTLNEHWHTDVSFNPIPPKFTMLHAKAVPTIGGDTQFANQYLAYESLTPGLQASLETMSAMHRGDGLALMMGKDVSEAPSAVHPVVRTHPESGRKALYVCAAFTRWIDGWGADESAGLLRFLFERSSRPDFTYRHQWQPGDVVIWDNRCVLHYAIHDHQDGARILHRITIDGEVPV